MIQVGLSTLLDTSMANDESQTRKVETAQARTTPVTRGANCRGREIHTVMIKHTRNRRGTQARIILPFFQPLLTPQVHTRINILHPVSNSPSFPCNFPLCMLVHEKKKKQLRNELTGERMKGRNSAVDKSEGGKGNNNSEEPSSLFDCSVPDAKPYSSRP